MHGTIKRIDVDKGFGFILPDGEHIAHFFHQSTCGRPAFLELREGQRVTFESVPSARGLRAEQVRAAFDIKKSL